MTPARRCLNAGRALLARHAVAGVVPALELRAWLAEMEAVLDADGTESARVIPEPHLYLVDPERNAHGYPTELPPR